MKTRQTLLKNLTDPKSQLAPLAAIEPTLLLVFGAPAFFAPADFAALLAGTFPTAVVLGCSSAAEITTAGVHADSCVITAVRFDATAVRPASTALAGSADSRGAGRRLAEQLAGEGLQAVLIFGPGLDIDGSALTAGMVEKLGTQVPITGGLAGDNAAFARTWTIGPAGVSDRAIVAVGLYGSRLRLGHGAVGGWEPGGPPRRVTRCAGKVLYELDGEAALEVYKRNLGDYARNLPASGLLFPFAMVGDNPHAGDVIRTVLGVDARDGSLTLAAEIEPNRYLRPMQASIDSLVDGAEAAAVAVRSMNGLPESSLALLVSCADRRRVMGERVAEEVEAVASVLGRNALLAGFYSYGGICPPAPGAACRLYNQTMTITSLAEA